MISIWECHLSSALRTDFLNWLNADLFSFRLQFSWWSKSLLLKQHQADVCNWLQAGWCKVKVPLFRQKPYKIFGREIYIKGGVVCNTRDSIIWSSLCTGHEPNFWSGSTNTWDSAVYRFYDSKNMNNFRYILLSTKSALCLQFLKNILELNKCWVIGIWCFWVPNSKLEIIINQKTISVLFLLSYLSMIFRHQAGSICSNLRCQVFVSTIQKRAKF